MNPSGSVLFIGSAPLKSAASVFDALSQHVGDVAIAAPDGDQAGWLGAVFQNLMAHPDIEITEWLKYNEGQPEELNVPIFRVRLGADVADVRLGPFGFAETAGRSYAEFKRMREAGKFTAATRFQVSLPTPYVCIEKMDGALAPLLAIAEQAMLEEVAGIARCAPADDLAIQWDVCELIQEECRRRPGEGPQITRRPGAELPTLQASLDSIAKVANATPPDAALGFHLCYGSPGGKHVIEPIDTQLLVEFMNGISDRVARPIAWIHLPVPVDRDDAAYFAPLKSLRLHPETTVYLGLVHEKDGVEGAARRIKAARTAIGAFGVATECGLRDVPEERFPAMLNLHRDVARLL